MDDMVSRQERTETHACDLIDRQAAIDVVGSMLRRKFGIGGDLAEITLAVLPSAQQDCTECPEYDHETHYCPKYCRVVRQTLAEAQQKRTGRWLPDNNSVYEMRFICSGCKESQVVPTIGFTKYKPVWDFCPICGSFNGGDNNEAD